MERRATVILLMLSLLAPLLMGAAAVEGEDLLRETEWPWNCCDKLFCPMMWPPRCTCRDVLKKCDDACQYCEEEDSGYVCLDVLNVPDHGEPPRRCNPASTGA